MKSYSGITWKYLKVQKKRTILTILGIVLSVALITSIGTMVMSYRDKLIQDAIKETGDYYAVFRNVAADDVGGITSHVRAAKSSVTVFQGYVPIQQLSDEERMNYPEYPAFRYLKLDAYDSNAFNMLSVALKEGRLPKAPNEIALDYTAAEIISGKPDIGDKIKLSIGERYYADGETKMKERDIKPDEIFRKNNEKEYIIVGLLNSYVASSSNCFFGAVTFLDSAHLNAASACNVYVKTSSPQDARSDAAQISADVGLNKVKPGQEKVKIEYNEKVLRLSAQSMDPVLNQTMKYILAFIMILIILSTIAVIYNAFHISVLERITQFGILRCTGASPGQIRKVVFKEALILSLFGIPAGLLCGVVAMKVVMYFIGMINFSMINLFDKLEVKISLPVMILSALLGIVTVFLSAWLPARHASRVSPLEAVRNTGMYSKENLKKLRKKTFVRHFLGIEGQIAVKNLRRNRKRFRITVFSMSISIVLYIVFGTFINFFYSMGIVYGELGYDFSLARSGIKGISTEQYDEIKRLPGVETVFKNMYSNVSALIPDDKFNKRFAELDSKALQEKQEGITVLKDCMIGTLGDENLGELNTLLKSGKISREDMDKENGVILLAVNKFYSDKISKSVIINAVNYQPGDEISIASDSGENNNVKKEYKTVKIQGILEKGTLGNEYVPNGAVQFITTEQVYDNITGNTKLNEVVIRLKTGAQREPVLSYLKNTREKDASYRYTDITELENELNSTATAMSIFLYGFVAVIALIGCLNIINTISTNLLLRTRELSVLKAVGMTKNGIKKLVGLEGILYGLIAAAFGGIIGTILSYFLYIIMIGVREIEWVMPWQQLISGIAGTIVITLAASYIPLKRINKGNIIDNIRMEN